MAADRLRVAISPDIPPYVINQATDGLEVALVGQALADYELRFVQMPYAELEIAVQQGRADVSIGVQQMFAGVFYSGPFITFVNDAISKRAAGLTIDRPRDLTRYRVLTWENAWYDLGGEFGRLYAPGSPYRVKYAEFADQREQVRRFWAVPDNVAVIDRAIFFWFSRQMGHSAGEVRVHDLFAPVTDFRVAFRDATVRDAFRRGLDRLCDSGNYRALLDRYGIVLERTVCQRYGR
ncbi:MAG: amino acid ABC transporter [Alphaproteobacteria bacterium]